MDAALSFALSLFMSIALVPFLIRYAGELGLVDTPDGIRKIHSHAIPRSGGLAIAIAFFLTILYLTPDWTIASYLGGAFIIVVLGVLDDRYELPFYWKFLGQIAAIIVFLSGDIQFENIPFFADSLLPHWLVVAGVFFFILAVTNAVALSDGLDGLAAGTNVVSLFFIGYLGIVASQPIIAVVAMAIVGALIGFLRYNTYPARVFMGDTGSQFIGYSSASLAILVTQLESSPVSPLLPILIFGLPLLDTAMVMTIRLSERRSPFSPDKNHIHHQLMGFGFHHYEAVAIIYFLQFAFVSAAYFYRFAADQTIIIVYASFVTVLLSMVFFARSRQWRYHQIEEDRYSRERRNRFLRRFNWIYLHGAKITAASLVVGWIGLSLIYVDIDHNTHWLAQLSLLTAFIFGAAFPRYPQLSTRIICYAVSVLSLYPFWVAGDAIGGRVLDVVIGFIGILLILSIRLTRKEQFRLDNQDILVLLILLAGPLLPSFSENGVAVGVMLLRLAVMIYAIEYILNREHGRYLLLTGGGTAALFIIGFFPI